MQSNLNSIDFNNFILSLFNVQKIKTVKNQLFQTSAL